MLRFPQWHLVIVLLLVAVLGMIARLARSEEGAVPGSAPPPPAQVQDVAPTLVEGSKPAPVEATPAAPEAVDASRPPSAVSPVVGGAAQPPSAEVPTVQPETVPAPPAGEVPALQPEAEKMPAADEVPAVQPETPATKAPDTREQEQITRNLGALEQVSLMKEEQRFVELTNVERKKLNLPELIVVPLLVTTARDKSKEMHDLKYWGHESPDKTKRTALPRVLSALADKPVSMVVGENLYYCSRVLLDQGHQALMNSPTHRKNILNPEYRYFGIGAYIGDDGQFWVTEHFLAIQY